MLPEKFFAACRSLSSLVTIPPGKWVQALMANTRRIGLFLPFTSPQTVLIVPNTGGPPNFSPAGLGIENFTTAIWGYTKDGPIIMSEWWAWCDAASACVTCELILEYDPCGVDTTGENESSVSWTTDIPKQQGMATPIGDTPSVPDISHTAIATSELSAKSRTVPKIIVIPSQQITAARQAAGAAVAGLPPPLISHSTSQPFPILAAGMPQTQSLPTPVQAQQLTPQQLNAIALNKQTLAQYADQPQMIEYLKHLFGSQ